MLTDQSCTDTQAKVNSSLLVKAC